MERLTIPKNKHQKYTDLQETNGDACSKVCLTMGGDCGKCPVNKALDRLSAYEDTGLAPENIPTGSELANIYAAMQKLKEYEALGTVEYMTGLTAERDAAQGTWFSVKDRLPELWDSVIVHWEDKTDIATYWRGKLCPYWKLQRYGTLNLHTVTHWMPLPEPPKEDL